jgi:hypothetical protein
MERFVMSHLGDVVWVSQDPVCDPMCEFGVEDNDEPTRPVLRPSLFQRVAAVSRIAVPQAPPPEAPVPVTPPAPSVDVPSPPAAVVETAAEPVAVEPVAVETVPVETATAPPAAAAPLVPATLAAQRGRWFVGIAALGLLAIGQAPFVVLWALQTAQAPPPIAIEIARPPIAFASAAPVPVERTLAPPPWPAAPAPRPAPAGSLSGWLRVEVPVPMRIVEDGRLLGTTDVDRLMLPTGDHVLELRNDELGFSTRQTVTIAAGETSVVPVRLPSAAISINAKPWAEAWVDGERVGDTPIGTLMRTIGRHEVMLRHPELGERRVPVVVTLGQPARVSVDFKAGK